jgi:lauroyl/myristoyl acyltransferase
MSSQTINKKYQEFESRASKLQPLFKATRFIHKYRLFRPFLYIPTIFINSWAHLIGPLALKSKKLKKRIFGGLAALYPKVAISSKQKEKLFHANAVYMAMLYLDAMFQTSNINVRTLEHFIEFKGIDNLESALKKGKGVIVPTVHVGSFFQVLAALSYYRPELQVTTVYQPRNKILYESIMARPELTNFHAMPSTSFSKLQPILIDHLKKNHVFVVYYDYSSAHQMRLPFDQGTYPYLITTPQSLFKLHSILDTPIVPVKVIPNGQFSKSIIEFVDFEPISKISQEFKNAPIKTLLGEIAIKVNSIFAPYLRKFNHIWEEFRKFTTRTSDSCDFPPDIDLAEIIRIIQEKCVQIIDRSYESGRNDEGIKTILLNGFDQLKALNVGSSGTVYRHQKSIDLNLMDSLGEIHVLLNELIKILENLEQNDGVDILLKTQQELKLL